MSGARSAARQALDLAELEDDFLDWVVELATTLGWLVHHARPARTARGWRTAIKGHKGAPDLLMARRGVVILAELKTMTGRVTAEQRRWHAELGELVYVWRPSDRDQIQELLR